MKRTLVILGILAFFFATFALINAGSKETPETTATDSEVQKPTTPKMISPEEAKNIIESDKEYILLDVRTEEEFALEHIKNAINLPDYEIALKFQEILPEKDAQIIVYCQSGRRSVNAAKMLVELGYTSVHDLGGINDWPYDTIK
jgi:rhodanese-related sulfurtransferase